MLFNIFYLTIVQFHFFRLDINNSISLKRGFLHFSLEYFNINIFTFNYLLLVAKMIK